MGGLLTYGLGHGSLVTGGLGFSPIPPVIPTEPNPAETLWTLGFGGAAWDGSLGAGFALGLNAQLLNDGVVVGYDGTATLDATAWPGGDEGASFTPSATWDATNGGHAAGRVVLSFAASQTTTLDPGEYRIQVGVTWGGSRSLVYDGSLRLLEIPGSGSSGLTYCSDSDLRREYDQLDMLSNRRSDTAGWLDMRIMVAELIRRRIVEDYNPRPGFTKARQNIPHPVVGMDVDSPTAVPISKFALSAAIESGGLIAERKLRVIAARWVIAEILERQESDGPNSFREEASRFRMMVEDAWRDYWRQVDVNADGVPDYLVKMDCILLPPGTSP